MYSAFQTLYEGFSDGFIMGADLIGLAYSRISGKRTLGQMGFTGTNWEGKRDEKLNYNSGLYKTGKILGGLSGTISVLLTFGLIQLFYLVVDGANIKHRKL